jgi:DNA (cytosine-5)-methyltransferase 1
VARWVGEKLVSPGTFHPAGSALLPRGVSWPRAAWGHKGKVFAADFSMWPVQWPRPHLADFLAFPRADLSIRASSGFLSRARESTLTFEPGFKEAVAEHIDRMSRASAA